MKNKPDTLTSDSQTGFVKGRYIGESIHLVYDIMNYTKLNTTAGLLMLIDFENPFNSISWKFMYTVLHLFGSNCQMPIIYFMRSNSVIYDEDNKSIKVYVLEDTSSRSLNCR